MSFGISGTRGYRRCDRPDDAPARTKRGGYAEVGGGAPRVDSMADDGDCGEDDAAADPAASAAADPRSAVGHAVWSEHRKRQRAAQLDERERDASAAAAKPEERPGCLRPRWDRNGVAFLILGLINNFGYVVMLTAALHLVSGEAGLVLLACTAPSFTLKLATPFFLHKLSYRTRVLCCAVLSAASFYITAMAEGRARLLGVVCASLASGGGSSSTRT